MKLTEIDLIGKPTPSFEQIMHKHNVTKQALQSQLDKGIVVELEHTGDRTLAREIALDHLDEFPDYYSRLEKAEKQ